MNNPKTEGLKQHIPYLKICGNDKVLTSYWNNLHHNAYMQECIDKIAEYFDTAHLTIDIIQCNNNCSMRKVKSFHFYDSFKSCGVCFDNPNTKKVLMKINSNFVMEFEYVLEITHEDESVSMMYGKYWQIHESTTSDAFCNDYYASMDSIKVTCCCIVLLCYFSVR